MNKDQLKQKLMDIEKVGNSYSYNTASSVIKNNTSNGETGDLDVESFTKSGISKSWLKSKNTLASDPLAGIVELVSTVLEAPSGATIGRPMVTITETTLESIRIRLPTIAVGSDTNSKKKGNSVGERNKFLTLTPDQEIENSEEYDDNYLENSPWNVTQRQIQAISKGHDIKETKFIIDFYNNLIASSLATGAVLTPKAQNLFSYSDMVRIWESLGDFDGTIMAMNKKTYSLLLDDPNFKDKTIFGSILDIKTGKMGTAVLGFDILISTLMPDNIVLGIDVPMAGQYVLRRNKVLKTFQPSISSEQVQVSSRFDLKLGRTGSVARMDISLAP